MAKKVFYDAEAREKILGGAKALYDAVKVTFGPKGRNVIIEKSYGAPTITHDGVTVAEAVELPKEDDATLGYEMGAKLIKTAAQKLNKVAGDGTTTVTVLTYNIIAEANKLIAAGHNPMDLRKGIEAAGAEIVKGINKTAEKIDGDSQKIAEVATISADTKTHRIYFLQNNRYPCFYIFSFIYKAAVAPTDTIFYRKTVIIKFNSYILIQWYSFHSCNSP